MNNPGGSGRERIAPRSIKAEQDAAEALTQHEATLKEALKQTLGEDELRALFDGINEVSGTASV